MVIQGRSETQIQVFLPPAKPQSLFPVLGHLPKYDPVPKGLTDCLDGGPWPARGSFSLSPHSSLALLQNIKSFWPPSFLSPYSMPSQCPQGLASLLPGSDPHHPRNQTTTRKLSEFSFELEERVVLGERREYSLGLSLSESWKSVFHCNCHSILCVSLYGDAYIHFKE